MELSDAAVAAFVAAVCIGGPLLFIAWPYLRRPEPRRYQVVRTWDGRIVGRFRTVEEASARLHELEPNLRAGHAPAYDVRWVG